MLDRKTLRAPAALLLGGLITYVVVTFLHTGGPANDHKVIFADYAGSHDWAAVHLGQFAGMAAMVAGLVGLYGALYRTQAGGALPGAAVGRLGAVFACVALALYGVLQAVDGVALKQAVDAWVSAPAADKPTRFANAETVRWLEWGTRSYQSFALGLALLLLGIAVAWTAHRAGLARSIGYLMGLSGLAYLVQGWTVGSDGFSATNTSAILAAYVLMLAWVIWLAVLAWRPTQSAGRSGSRTRLGESVSSGR
jgi:hypothetical protein